MKLKLLSVFIFLLSVGASAQWLGVVGSKESQATSVTVVQSHYGSTASPGTITVTPTTAIGSGHQVLVYVSEYIGAPPSPPVVTDSTVLNTYTVVSGSDTDGHGSYSFLYSCSSISGAPTSISAPVTGTYGGVALIVEVSGQSGSPIDQYSFKTLSGSSPYTGNSVTTTASSELLIALGGDTSTNVTFTTGATWTTILNSSDANGAAFAESKPAASIGTYSSVINTNVTASGGMQYLVSIKSGT